MEENNVEEMKTSSHEKKQEIVKTNSKSEEPGSIETSELSKPSFDVLEPNVEEEALTAQKPTVIEKEGENEELDSSEKNKSLVAENYPKINESTDKPSPPETFKELNIQNSKEESKSEAEYEHSLKNEAEIEISMDKNSDNPEPGSRLNLEAEETEETKKGSIGEISQPQGEENVPNVSLLTEVSQTHRKSVDNKREEIFHNACIDRKKSAFEALRIWDEHRANLLNLHRNLIETIQAQIDAEVKKSEDFVALFIKYLKERQSQESHYSRHQLTKLALFTKETNSIYQSVVEEFENSHLEHCKKVAKFAQIIETNIINHLLESELIAYEKKIEGIRDNLIKLKRSITKLNIEASEKSARYSTLYYTMINAPYRKKTYKDLFRRQISFLTTAREQVKVERVLGKEIMFYWEVVVKLERNRREMLNKSLSLYINSFIEVYGKNNATETIQNLLSLAITNSEENHSLDITKVLSVSDLKAIKEHSKNFNTSEVNFNELRKFFEDFTIDKLDDKRLTIKELKCRRDVGGILSSYKDCKLIFTVDGFILCFDKEPSRGNVESSDLNKPDMVFNIDKGKIVRKKDTLLELSQPRPGFILNSLNKYYFKFNKSDDVEEFMECLSLFKYQEKLEQVEEALRLPSFQRKNRNFLGNMQKFERDKNRKSREFFGIYKMNSVVFECGIGDTLEKIEADKRILNFSKVLSANDPEAVIPCPLISGKIMKLILTFYELNNYYSEEEEENKENYHLKDAKIKSCDLMFNIGKKNAEFMKNFCFAKGKEFEFEEETVDIDLLNDTMEVCYRHEFQEILVILMKSIACHFYCGPTEAEFEMHKKKFNIPQEIPPDEQLKIMNEEFPQPFEELNQQLLADFIKNEPALKEKLDDLEKMLQELDA